MQRSYFPYLLVLPAYIYVLGMMVYPNAYNYYLSYHEVALVSPTGESPFIALDNYFNLLKDDRFFLGLRHSFEYLIGAVSLEVILGMGLALMLNEEIRGKTFFRIVTILPMTSTPVVMALLWSFMMAPERGVFNYFLDLVGLPPLAWVYAPKTAMMSVILVDVWIWTPFVALCLLAGLQSLPTEPLEAAKVDGASAFQTFTRVIVPMLKPILILTITLRVLDAFRWFDTIYAMTRGGPIDDTRTLNIYAFDNAFIYTFFGYAAVIVLVLFCISFSISLVLIRWMERGEVTS